MRFFPFFSKGELFIRFEPAWFGKYLEHRGLKAAGETPCRNIASEQRCRYNRLKKFNGRFSQKCNNNKFYY